MLLCQGLEVKDPEKGDKVIKGVINCMGWLAQILHTVGPDVTEN